MGSIQHCSVPSAGRTEKEPSSWCLPSAQVSCQLWHHADHCSPQERQRLETILNLCAEYTKTDGAEPGDVHRILVSEADAGRRVPRGARALVRAAEELQQRESLERSDEENLKEECSSTESTHHEVRGWPCLAIPQCAMLCHANLPSPRSTRSWQAPEPRRHSGWRRSVPLCLGAWTS